MEGTIHQENIPITNIYASTIGAPDSVRETLKDLNDHMGPDAVIVEDFNTPLSNLNRFSKLKTSKDI